MIRENSFSIERTVFPYWYLLSCSCYNAHATTSWIFSKLLFNNTATNRSLYRSEFPTRNLELLKCMQLLQKFKPKYVFPCIFGFTFSSARISMLYGSTLRMWCSHQQNVYSTKNFMKWRKRQEFYMKHTTHTKTSAVLHRVIEYQQDFNDYIYTIQFIFFYRSSTCIC